MEQIKIEEICGYLPYGLTAIDEYNVIRIVDWELQSYNTKSVGLNFIVHSQSVQVNCFKPLLLPLSSLTKEIADDFYFYKEPYESFSIDRNTIRYNMGVGWRNVEITNGLDNIAKCYKHHLDIFNLIGRGLAIDKTTITT